MKVQHKNPPTGRVRGGVEDYNDASPHTLSMFSIEAHLGLKGPEMREVTEVLKINMNVKIQSCKLYLYNDQAPKHKL